MRTPRNRDYRSEIEVLRKAVVSSSYWLSDHEDDVILHSGEDVIHAAVLALRFGEEHIRALQTEVDVKLARRHTTFFREADLPQLIVRWSKEGSPLIVSDSNTSLTALYRQVSVVEDST